MNNRKPIDYLIIISIILLFVGIVGNNKQLNLVIFLILIICVMIKYIKKDSIIKVSSRGNSNEAKRITRKSSMDKVQYFKEYMDRWLQEDYDAFNEEYIYYDNNCCPNCGCALNTKIESSK